VRRFRLEAEGALNCVRAARGLKGAILRADVTTDRSTSAFPAPPPGVPAYRYPHTSRRDVTGRGKRISDKRAGISPRGASFASGTRSRA